MLTNERLAEIRERCEAATPEPWVIRQCGETGELFVAYRWDDGEDSGLFNMCQDIEKTDATFIAHAREDVPALLAEIDRLRARERKYNLMLLEQLQKVYSEGTGPDTLYFSDGLQTSVAIIQELEEADLFERVGEGPGGHVMGRLTAEGLRMMEEMK